jgi:Sec-independent protein secretion pathway component TatC
MLALTIIFCYLFVFLLVYFFVVPVFCGFLLGFGVDSAAVTIQLEARIHSYVTLTIKIFFVVFALVQIPICFFLLEAFGWLTAQTLFENRRFFLATLLVFSGFLAPPEIALQFVVFLSFYLSFEIMIWVMVYNSSNKSSYLL